MKNKYVKFLLLLLILAGVIVTYLLLDPATNKYFPACPFYKFTGLFCPGCGAQRALHYLLTGNIKAAAQSNILLLLFLPFLIFYYGVEAINYFKKTPLINISIANKIWFIYSIAGIIIIFWIIRNLTFTGANFFAPH